jgi:hypothetical protein
MEALNPHKPAWLSILRWTARIIALLIVAFLLMMFIGESMGNNAHFQLTSRDYFILSLFGITMVGLLIGLRFEFSGGLISLISTLTHIIFLSTEHHGGLFFFYLMLIPGILYLLSWYFNKILLLPEGNSHRNPH